MLTLRLAALPRAAWAAARAGSLARDISTSASSQHSQTAPAEDDAAQAGGLARWKEELGAIRNDWT